MSNDIASITEAWLSGKPLLARRAPATNHCLQRLAEDFWALVDAIGEERKAELKAARAANRVARRRAAAGVSDNQVAA